MVLHPEQSRSRTPRPLPQLALIATALLGISACAADAAPVPSTSTSTSTSTSRDAFRVNTVDYDLGATAFSRPWFHGFGSDGFPDLSVVAPMELTATVHYPIDSFGARHPLVEIQHGLWNSCADPSVDTAQYAEASRKVLEYPDLPPEDGMKGAQDPRGAPWRAILDRDLPKLNGWPCEEGVPPIESYRGYDYLGEALATAGFIVVSIGQNGANNGDQYMADGARAAVANRHLALWAQLDRTGSGPLAGRFVERGTETPAEVEFTHRVDLTRVAVLGHSRGGRGAMRQASDTNRGDLPEGVRIRAAVTLATPSAPDQQASSVSEYLSADTPTLSWIGTCDDAGTGAGDFLERMTRRTSADLVRLTVRGANHDYLNTMWSPGSGTVSAEDDARHPAARPGECIERVDGEMRGPAVRQLTEQQERAVADTYVVGFLRRELLGQKGLEPLLDGSSQPLRGQASVEAELIRPAG